MKPCYDEQNGGKRAPVIETALSIGLYKTGVTSFLVIWLQEQFFTSWDGGTKIWHVSVLQGQKWTQNPFSKVNF